MPDQHARPDPSVGPAEGWVECRCGNRHWGRYGAAGLLLSDGERVVLQHRAPWSHLGGTWALPGGARHRDESALAGALREAQEEAGIDPTTISPIATTALVHPDWSYTTVIARSTGPAIDVRSTDAESVEITWVPLAAVEDRPLLPAFADAWPQLRTMLATDLVVVVDAANVVGSRPDGWWRDRRGATERLIDRLARLDGVPADLLGQPGQRWWPRWHVVTEGAARDAATSGAVVVEQAPGSGDDAIVAAAERLDAEGATVVVATADRELRSRLGSATAHLLGPGTLRDLLDG